MAIEITYKVECHCGGDATTTVLDLTQRDGEPLVIDVELSIGQTDFLCENCGCVMGTGDLDVQASSEDCALDDEDEPEDSDGPDLDGSECIECGSSANPCDCGEEVSS